MLKTTHFILILCLVQSITIAQTNPGQVIQTAFQKVNAGNADEAIDDLNKLLEENPDHAGALNALGFAYRSKQEFSKSLEAYQKVEKIRSTPGAMFNLGIAHALVKDLDKSFEVLMKVKESNAFNITNIGLSPAASILSTDPRYQKLYPSAEEYADPFVETDVKILQDWKGENAGDQFGWIGRNIGDVNGDGVSDATSSAPTNNEGGNAAGKVYVYSGKTGKELWTYVAKDANGQLGMSIERAGDVNGDGTPDVVAGAPYANKTYVFSGKDGKILFEWTGKDEKGAFGRGVCGTGDVNGDGFGDVLIGEPYQIWGGPLNSQQIEQPGNVYLYSGKDGSILQQWKGDQIGDGFGTALAGKTVNKQTFLMIGAPGAGNGGRVTVYKAMDADSFFAIDADSTGSSLGGMFMSVVGDVDGDDVQDLYASDWSNSALGNSTGRIYVHSGATGEQLMTLTGEAAGDGFGIGVADAGDVNNDGYDDLVIGSWQHASAAPSGGKIYVYSGKDGSLIRTLTGKIAGETLGFDTTGIGDVDGDGVVDLLLTSAWSAINGTRSGRMFIISGK